MYDLFICHSSSDHAFVKWLSTELGKKGIKSWVDEGEILVGDSLIGKIDEGISKTRFFAVVLSRNSVKSRWVKKELEMAFTKEFKKRKVFILPLVVEDCKIPLYIETKRFADFRESSEKAMRNILEVLVGKSQFECLIFRQMKPAIFSAPKGYRQKITIRNYSGITYRGEDVPLILRGKHEPNICFFGIKIKNLTNELKENIKVKLWFKFGSSNKKIIEYLGNKKLTPQIISGGIGSNYVSYNIPLLHPFDKHRFGLATNSNKWPEVEIIGESSIWDGKVNRFDVIPQELERVP